MDAAIDDVGGLPHCIPGHGQQAGGNQPFRQSAPPGKPGCRRCNQYGSRIGGFSVIPGQHGDTGQRTQN